MIIKSATKLTNWLGNAESVSKRFLDNSPARTGVAYLKSDVTFFGQLPTFNSFKPGDYYKREVLKFKHSNDSSSSSSFGLSAKVAGSAGNRHLATRHDEAANQPTPK